MSGSPRLEYGRRVDRDIDHIRARLRETLTLGGLASVAAFSPFHFHRVFKAVTGETLFEFIQRLRLERAGGARRWRARRERECERNPGKQVGKRRKAGGRRRTDTRRKEHGLHVVAARKGIRARRPSVLRAVPRRSERRRQARRVPV